MNQVGGSIGAAPIWQEYMERALQGQPVEKFKQPAGIKELKVDKLTGLLPGAGGATKTEIFTDGNAPRDKSSVKTSSADTCKPDVSITNPRDGTLDAGPVTIQATATSQSGIKQVEFTVDGRSVGSSDSPPFTVTANLSSGSHTITATATGDCTDTVSGSGLHSERPTNPAWEDPVQAWIKGHGLKLGADDNATSTQTATDSVTVTVGGGPSPTPKPSPTPVTLGPANNLVAYLRDDQFVG